MASPGIVSKIRLGMGWGRGGGGRFVSVIVIPVVVARGMWRIIFSEDPFHGEIERRLREDID